VRGQQHFVQRIESRLAVVDDVVALGHAYQNASAGVRCGIARVNPYACESRYIQQYWQVALEAVAEADVHPVLTRRDGGLVHDLHVTHWVFQCEELEHIVDVERTDCAYVVADFAFDFEFHLSAFPSTLLSILSSFLNRASVKIFMSLFVT